MGTGNRRMLKKGLLLSISVGIIFIGGCVSKEALSTKLINESPEFSKGYEQYQQLQKEGKITSEGNITQEQESEVRQPAENENTSEGIRVTFATNSLLDIFYYSDAELTKRLETEECYLNPNDCIYASVPIGKSDYSNMYSFSGFRIYEYDAEGKKSLKETLVPGADKMVYQIPMMTEGYGISIVPVGQYTDRIITMSDYVINETGEKQELSGAWTLNNKEYYPEEVAISPLTSYVVSYAYDKDAYYFVSATPESACHYPRETGNMEGEVIFKNQEPGNAAEFFSVELHKYLSAMIDNKARGLVYVTIKDKGESVAIDKQIAINKLQCGSVLEIKTDKVHKLDCTNLELQEPTKVSDGYLYTVVLPNVAETELNLSVLNWDKKSIGITVDKSDALGWWEKISGGNKDEASILRLSCGDESYTYEDLQDGKKVLLNEYDNLEISVNTKLPEGKRVHITINNKEEFIVNPDSTEFKKTLAYDDVSSLRIVIQNTENEDVEQQAKLKVVLDKSLDSNVLFNVASSGKNIVTSKGYIKGQETICNKNVDAEQNIIISAEGTQLIAGTAIKLVVKKNGETAEIRYATGRDLNEIISTKDASGTCCGEVEVIISVVAVATHRALLEENCAIELEFADADRKKVKDGDVLEVSRKVVLTITAKDGYYISFGGWLSGIHKESDSVYKDEMKYSDYVEDIKGILEDNPVKKLITVTLSDVKPYQVGTVSFEIDGESKPAGIYSLKEGEKIKLTFRVDEESGYGIVNDKLTAFVNKYLEKKSKTIKVSSEIDGTVISVEKYMKDMTVEKMEE